MASDKIKQKIEYLTQFYFEDDKPIPWFGDLTIYPILVSDYYPFHTSIECLTIDKNKDVSGVGIPMSHLDYLIYKMKDENGQVITNQFIRMMEMTFRIKNGLYCDNPECENYEDSADGTRTIKSHEEINVIGYEQIWKDFAKVKGKEEQLAYFTRVRTCPKCGKTMREVLTISKTENDKNVLYIYNTGIKAKEYDELRQIVCRYNMLDWDDDYIDPDLEADLALKAKLENKGMVSPTLEKQKAVLCVRTAYKLEELDNLSLRKLALLIRTSDAVLHYQIYRSASMSGLVTFKHDIKHYLYSSDKKDISDELTSVESLKEKMKNVMS